MRMRSLIVVAVAASLATVAFAAQEEFGTAKEAEAMVGKAVARIKAVGAEKAYQDFTGRAPGFADRDLYVVVYDLEGRVLAHGQNAKMVGKELIDLRDPDGKQFVKERLEIVAKDGKGWQQYKFQNPATKKVEVKVAYFEKVEDVIVVSGAYKP
jgi:cytochrome c